ncbi:MAG TPA: dethiobiotin synthase [Solirubrobacteraceae bacterium]|nr:dethiobiotin synthase [Solirubrobacteraceae bacterium]
MPDARPPSPDARPPSPDARPPSPDARPPLRGCFVTGTDTGVGKSVLSAAITAALLAAGTPVRAFKPILTGLEEAADPVWPRDHELLATVTGADPADVVLATYGPPVSPHLAAELSGRPIDLAAIGSDLSAAAAADPDAAMIVEGVGGLLVPLGPGSDVRDLARLTGLPLVVAARPGLGTINHTLLTLAAARTAGLDVRGVVLTPWPADPDRIALSNRETIAALAAIEVQTLGLVPGPEPAALAAAAAHLPLSRWLA